MTFELTKEFIEDLRTRIQSDDDTGVQTLVGDLHFADLAEVMDQLNLEEATVVFKLVDSDKTSDALMELDEDLREDILAALSPAEIATELEELDTDDAADILNELDTEIQGQVINQIQDEQHAEDIVDLLRYQEGTAGAIMAKELVQVNEKWNVDGCVTEMRAQAENVTRVHSIYVVDDRNKLMGRLSLKDLITAPIKAQIRDIYIPKVDYVQVNTEIDDVAKIMRKYDLEALPVVDEAHRLLGRITIDDIVDYITDEAERDYQLAAGISQDVEADDTILELTRARLPWLVLGLFGGLGAVYIMQGYEGALERFPELFFFTPLVAAMAGNVGVQSSAIIVQGLANDTVTGSLLNRLIKEVGLALINGIALSLLVVLFGYLANLDTLVSITIALAMLSVIIMAALVGTFVPILLDKRGIDPAIATGPFITTSNDIFGILLFFIIAKNILGF